MRILDEDNDLSLDNVTLYLTLSEASALRDSLNELLNKSTNHYHVNNEDFQKEISVCIYDVENLKNFDQRSIDLILNDK